MRGLKWSLKFALAEIRHEWLFALGVAFAVCSVITTTSLLWGTRSGMVASMREQLMQDPTVRELAAIENISLSRLWFDDLRKDPRVDFLTPSVGRINLDGSVSTMSQPRRTVAAAFIPTALGDPLGGGFSYKSGTGHPVPCVISALAAEELGVREGATLRIEVTRNDTSGIVRAPLDLSVGKVLDMRQTRRRMVLMPLQILENIETFKLGWPVPSLGWIGSEDVDMPAYVDSLTLHLGESRSLRAFLDDASSSGFNVTTIEGDDLVQTKIRISSKAESMTVSTLRKLFDLHKINDGTLTPHAEAMATFQGVKIRLLTDDTAININDFFAPPKKNEASGIQTSLVEIATLRGGRSNLSIPMRQQIKAGDEWFVPTKLAPVLGAAKYHAITYNHITGDMLPAREEYAGFRLYAKHLEDVSALRRELDNQGIKVRTNEDRISSVLTLDAALGKFLAFIITAGALGGCGALFASIHLSVERSRRSFAALQLMGIPPFYIMASAIFQAVLMVCAGTFFAFLLFQAGSRLLISVFSGNGEIGNRVCVLTFGQWGTLLTVALIFAIIATFPALLKARCKDPAVIARGE